MIFFRIDLGNKIGLGHYNRVQSLIKYLNLKKYIIIVDKISSNPFFKTNDNIISLYENSYFKNELEDANLFLKIIKKYKKPTVILDSYRLSYNWEKHIYKYCKKLILIDDFPEFKHFVDYYINHSPSFVEKNEKILEQLKKNNKKKTIFLLGPDYALFKSDYNKKKKINSDFIFYNGASGNLLVYEKIIKRLSKIKKKPFTIILIVGPFSKNYREVYKKFKKFKNVKIVHQPQNILNILVGAKFFISSAGISMFESSFLKIPTLLFKMNSNQNLIDFDYEKLGHYFSLEKKDLKDTSKIVNLIILMMNNTILIKKMVFKSSINIKKIKKNFQKYLTL